MKKFMVVLAVLASTIPVLSADSKLDIYGRLNLGIWYHAPQRYYDDTSSYITNSVGDTIGVNYGQKDSMDIIISNWIPFGAFGVKYKGDRFGANIAMGTRNNSYDYHFSGSFSWPRVNKMISEYITLSKWYMEWYINDYFTLLAGKSLAPTNFFPSDQLFFGGYGFNNTGCLSTGSYPMFQLSIHDADNRLEGKIALIKVDTSGIEIRNKGSQGDEYQCSAKIPKLEAGFNYSFEKGIFSTYGKFAGGFQTYEVTLYQMKNADPQMKKDSCTIDNPSYVIGGDIGFSLGPVSIAVDALYGMNIGNYGAFVGDQFGFWRTSDYMNVFFNMHGQNTGDSIKGWQMLNGTAFEIAAILKIKPKEFLEFEAGVGMVSGDHDFDIYSDRFENSFAWYFQTDITALEMLKISPEVGEFDFGPRKWWGRYFYWGLNLGIEF